jgi:hypothetical protein
MARYRGPKQKIARRFKEPIFGPSKALERKPHPPGQHGRNRRRKESDYSVQLKEKQKVKYTYGVLERQFRKIFDKAARKKGVTGENLLKFLEARLDNTVFRLGFARTRRQARQLVNHGHVMVNGRVLTFPRLSCVVVTLWQCDRKVATCHWLLMPWIGHVRLSPGSKWITNFFRASFSITPPVKTSRRISRSSSSSSSTPSSSS